MQFSDGALWQRWLLTDQRSVADRTDVVSFVTPVLTEPVRISGAPLVNLVASITGSDADWLVKLIDVYPDEVASQPEMGGYQLPVSMDIFRGRYREGFATAKAIAPNTPLPYRFILPTANHVFQPGHRPGEGGRDVGQRNRGLRRRQRDEHQQDGSGQAAADEGGDAHPPSLHGAHAVPSRGLSATGHCESAT